MLWPHFGSSLTGVLIQDGTILYILKHLPDYVHCTNLLDVSICMIHT